MSIWFFSDPHLGLERTSHTTPASRAKLKQRLFEQALNCFRQGEPVYCLGDLFDTESNDEAVILQGMAVVNGIDGVIAGNHDCPNREGRKSSLQLIQSVYPDKVISGEVGEPGFDFRWENEASVYFVPHMATQQLFDQSLEEVKASTVSQHKVVPTILCLHCNYDSGFADNDASLNLTRAKAEELLRVFDYILLGHEHIPRADFGGRLQILGNTHPTSFSDISDKFVWEFKDGKLIPHKIWDATVGYIRLTWEELLNTPTADWKDEQIQFMEVTGMAPAEKMPEIAKTVSDHWKALPDLLMLRNSVQVAQANLPQADGTVTKLQDLPSRVASELKDAPEMLGLWEGYLTRLNAV
jgi:hypothetical protein